ncbi:hypothetical protein, variant [Aphanomyces invadans]|uniref:Uncharacterized protein n=1 Tax=Aphanomyces invadans TaxID=157072 RepID=A0A024U158_9STRA|nr:hypothetical protein, variant [Aphanomyces invadans]ETW00171.1 hypothetical protein, variant [Aphanomyces invadans]|eukprot:XP_008871196.1 hypothetical protein, variant [Aphanomyces invadans]
MDFVQGACKERKCGNVKGVGGITVGQVKTARVVADHGLQSLDRGTVTSGEERHEELSRHALVVLEELRKLQAKCRRAEQGKIAHPSEKILDRSNTRPRQERSGEQRRLRHVVRAFKHPSHHGCNSLIVWHLQRVERGRKQDRWVCPCMG